MEKRYLVLHSIAGDLGWLGEWDTAEEAMAMLEEWVLNYTAEESEHCAWIVETVARRYNV